MATSSPAEWGRRLIRELVGPPPAGELSNDLARTARLLAEAESLFTRVQERLAGEVVHAIDAGDAARARALVDQKEQGQYVPLHDRLIRFMAETFGYVFQQFGPDELYRFHRATAEGQRQGFEKWERLTAEAAKHGVRAEVFRADLRQAGDIQGLVAGALRAFGRIDVLVNNAGISGAEKAFVDLAPEDWEDVLATNLRAPALLA